MEFKTYAAGLLPPFVEGGNISIEQHLQTIETAYKDNKSSVNFDDDLIFAGEDVAVSANLCVDSPHPETVVITISHELGRPRMRDAVTSPDPKEVSYSPFDVMPFRMLTYNDRKINRISINTTKNVFYQTNELEDFSSIINEMIKAHGYTNIIIETYSMGGMLAMHLASKLNANICHILSPSAIQFSDINNIVHNDLDNMIPLYWAEYYERFPISKVYDFNAKDINSTCQYVLSYANEDSTNPNVIPNLKNKLTEHYDEIPPNFHFYPVHSYDRVFFTADDIASFDDKMMENGFAGIEEFYEQNKDRNFNLTLSEKAVDLYWKDDSLEYRNAINSKLNEQYTKARNTVSTKGKIP